MPLPPTEMHLTCWVINGSTKTTFSGFETDDNGEMWLVLRELRDGVWVEIERTDAKNVRF